MEQGSRFLFYQLKDLFKLIVQTLLILLYDLSISQQSKKVTIWTSFGVKHPTERPPTSSVRRSSTCEPPAHEVQSIWRVGKLWTVWEIVRHILSLLVSLLEITIHLNIAEGTLQSSWTYLSVVVTDKTACGNSFVMLQHGLSVWMEL